MRVVAWTVPLLLAGCTSRLVLMAPLTAPATSYDCASATDAATCTPATVLDPAAETVSGAATIVLPTQCGGSFDRIVVRHRRQARRDALVTCGAHGGAPGPFACPALPDDHEPSLQAQPPCTAESSTETAGLALALPAACGGLANQLIVERLRSSTPSSFVVCAAPDNEPGSTP